MRIKKLELIGFKSFKDRTVIQFDAGITGIVGPNGCGKSNIVDALVWVMGEMSAKHLRGSSMEDVIFAGAENYAPLGMAEVSLTLENDGGPFPAKYAKHSEIMLTRRLHRNGESEYLVNKEQARLRDIQEVFMDTGAGSKGFSIIEQGAIGKIITAKPEDRRSLIEEAAGITKFKVRKRESQRKLQSTEQNLVRLQDILGEQKRQLDSLQRQAQRAERYRNLKNEIRDKDLWVSSKSFLSLEKDFLEAQEALENAQSGSSAITTDLSHLEANLEELRLTSVELEKNLEVRQEESAQAQSQVQKLELEIREVRFEIEQAKRDKEMTGSVQSQYQGRREALAADQERLQNEFTKTKTQAENLAEEFEVKKAEFQTVQNRIRQVDEELTEKRREMLVLGQSATHLEARLQSLDEKISDVEAQVEQSRQVEEELLVQKESFEKRRNTCFNQLESERQLQLGLVQDMDALQENMNLIREKRDEKSLEVNNFKDSLNEVSSRLYGLENLRENFEGFQEGVKNIMLWQRTRVENHVDGSVESSPEYQPLSEVVEVPETYEMAMEAALGQRLQSLLTKDSEKSLSAVDYLKTEKNGRSSFVSPDQIQKTESDGQKESLKAREGFKTFLNEVVQSPGEFETQVSHFLKDIAVVDGLKSALSLRADFPGVSFVTLDGDHLSADGVLTGGDGEGAESGVLKRKREITELSQKREEWAGKLALSQGVLKKLEAQEKNLETELEDAKRKAVDKEVQIAEFKKDLERAEIELRNSEQAVTRQKSELEKEALNLQTLQDDQKTLTDKLTEVRTQHETLESSVELLTTEYNQARDGVEDQQDEVTRLQVESTSFGKEAEGLQRNLDLVTSQLAEVEGSIAKMSEDELRVSESLVFNQTTIEEKNVELEHSIQRSADLKAQLAKEQDHFEKKSSELREIESTLGNHQATRAQHEAQLSSAQLKIEQVQMKQQYLLDQVMERYMLDLREEAPKFAEQDGDRESIEKEVSDLKAKLNRIGEVNLSAIEEYDDLIGRYEFMNQQFQDLTNSKEQLRKVIDRINRICSKRFKETFVQVNERFEKVFPVLFGGGEARLILIEDPDKSEMGIDIVARPPGKKAANVSLLSGGEKALTAVSLIFSIFLVKPSPFCLLDEVDAPLDDANVFRFNDLVNEMAKRSQIIIVTHNKHTMKVNDKLYGVTQEEKGVSKMVSVSLDEAEQVAVL